MTVRVFVDVDGVLADFTSSALRVVERVTGRRFAPADVKEFDFCRAIGLSDLDRSRVMRAIASTPSFARDLAVLPGARAAVEKLRDLDVEIRVATAPWDSHPTWDYDRRWWLKEHFSITPDRIHPGSDKFVLRGDFLVDDRAKHVAAWLEENPGRVGVLWRTPHNRTEVLPAGARETSSWDQLHRWVSDRADGHRQQLDMEVVMR